MSSDVIGELDIPDAPDSVPGVQRDISISAVLIATDDIKRRLALIESKQTQVVRNQTWVNETVTNVVQALMQAPGIGPMVNRALGVKGQ